MFNPFIRYETKFLGAFCRKGVQAFVLQTYERGRHPKKASSPAYLLTHYHDLQQAQTHMNAIASDPNRQIYYTNEPDDIKELQRMGQRDTDLCIYMSFKIPNAELQARKYLDKQLRSYISSHLKWRIRSNTVVDFALEVDFGEIYGVFRYGSNYHKVKLDEIDNYSCYVL